MSEIERMLPFFTERDDKILYGESIRDPLGLLPIWSAVGHELIPGLASVVSRIDGIQGVLFIYACLNALPHYTESKLADDKVLRFLERLWEYHLYHYRDKAPCFGIDSLSGVDFQLSTSRAGVVGTGLRQYYRGSCINKGIMAGNLRQLNEPYANYAKNMLSTKLVSWLKDHVANMHGDDYSVSAHGEYKKIRPHLEYFSSGSMPLWEALERSLISDVQKPWIQHAIAIPDWQSLPVPSLVSAVQEFADKNENYILKDQCQRILDCEPFVQILASAFLMSQEEGRSSIDALSQRLKNSAPTNLIQICDGFQRINLKSNRLGKLKDLAEHLSAENYSTFVSEFLQSYYGSVCKERGKNPIVYIDGSDIISLKPGKSGSDWSEPANPKHWNGYFIKSQISLYVDLMHRRGVSS